MHHSFFVTLYKQTSASDNLKPFLQAASGPFVKLRLFMVPATLQQNHLQMLPQNLAENKTVDGGKTHQKTHLQKHQIMIYILFYFTFLSFATFNCHCTKQAVLLSASCLAESYLQAKSAASCVTIQFLLLLYHRGNSWPENSHYFRTFCSYMLLLVVQCIS